jgi:hypothetical protein
MCTDPSSPAQFDHSLFLGCGDMKGAYRDGVEMLVQVKPSIVFSPKFSRTLVRNGIVVPARNLWPFHKVEREGSPSEGDSESSMLSSSTLSSEISQWTEIKDPFAKERGDTHTSDIDSFDFSRTPSLLTMYTDSTVEFNGSSFEGSHSSDLVPILSPCVRLSFSPARSGFSPSPFPSPSPSPFPSPVKSGLVAPPPSPFPSVRPRPSVSVQLATSVSSFRPRGRFYNPRYDPQHPLFEPHLLLPAPAVARSLPPVLDQDDNPLLKPDPDSTLDSNPCSSYSEVGSIPEVPAPAAARSLPPVLDQDDNSLLKPDLDLTLDSNPCSSYPVPGEWPDVDSGLEPASGPVGWLKAITSPAV